MEEKVGAAKAEVDKLFGADRVAHKLAEEKVRHEKVEVDGLGTVDLDMGQAEVFRLDEEDWEDQGPFNDGGGDWDGEGDGQRWIPEADGADQAVEQYWEARGRSESESTDMVEAVELPCDGVGTVDADMQQELEEEEDEDEEGHTSWTEELRAKKRRTEGGPKGGGAAESAGSRQGAHSGVR